MYICTEKMDTSEELTNNRNSICRVCMQSDVNNLFPIFNEIFSGDNAITVADIITECTKYPVTQNDLLPIEICNLCMEAARNAHKFKRQTEETYRRLKALYDIKWVPKEEKDSSYCSTSGGAINKDKYTQTDKSSEFKCENCSQDFCDENELREHYATSNDDNDDDCNSDLVRVHSFARRMNKETGYEYKCNICLKEFNHKNELSRHLIHVHMISAKKSNAQICKDYRERQKLTKPPKITPRPGTKSNAQKCKEYRERQKMKEDACSRSEKNALKCKEYREKLRIKKDLDNPKIKATLEEPEIENQEDDDDDDDEPSANPFASDEEDYNMKDEDVKKFIENITHPDVLIKDEPNDIIDEYSYDDIDESIMVPEAILLESDDDEVEYMISSSDYEPQYYFHHNTNPNSFSAAHKHNENSATNMFRCMVCNMEFKLRRILVRHMLTHNDERPFSCQICSKTFKRKDNLQKHLREVHHKNFSCVVCNERFGTFKRLIRHNQTNHRTSTKNK